MKDWKDLVLLMKEIRKTEGPVGASTLCNHMLYSQATIGRMLVHLEKEGYVRRVSNKGVVITSEGSKFLKLEEIKSNKRNLANELVNLSIDREGNSLLEMITIRELLEPYAAACAAERATERDIYTLENLAFAHRYNLSLGQPGNEENLSFHLEIARINNNRMLHKTIELLLTANEAYVEFSKAGEAQRDRQVTDHFRILNAIRERDASEAHNAMLDHLEDVARDVEQTYQRR